MEELLKEVMDSMEDQVKVSKRELFLGMAAVFMSGVAGGLMLSMKHDAKHCHKVCCGDEKCCQTEENGNSEECCQKKNNGRKKKEKCCL